MTAISAHQRVTAIDAALSIRRTGQHPRASRPPVAVESLDGNYELESVCVEALVCTGSPRSGGVDAAHVQRLMEAEWPLPPVLVHRPTMRIIDGFHRVAAAEQLGMPQIDAYVIDCSDESMFVLAVRANVTHGLPLSLADRRRAAERILCTHPDWSDRAISSATGLSAKTVHAIRNASDEHPQMHVRLGKDGRRRPLDAAAGRRLAAEVLAVTPNASLREVAAAVGVSPGTVRDVRARLSRGEDPVPSSLDPGGTRKRRQARVPGVPANSVPSDLMPVLMTLSKDPALRMNAAGRELLRWLHAHAVATVDSAKIVEFAPGHCIEHLIEFAGRCSANWALIAADLEHQVAQHQIATVKGLPVVQEPADDDGSGIRRRIG